MEWSRIKHRLRHNVAKLRRKWRNRGKQADVTLAIPKSAHKQGAKQ